MNNTTGRATTNMNDWSLPSRIATVLSLRNGITITNIPDEVLQRVNSIKVSTSDEWKSVGATGRNFTWRSSGKDVRDTNVVHHRQNNRDVRDNRDNRDVKDIKDVNQGYHQGYQGYQGSKGHQKYVSKFKKPDSNLEDNILNIIKGKLNTFSPTNYTNVKQFLEQILDSGETAFLKDFMVLVFKKAAAEQIYCPYYAKLLAELSKSYGSLNMEMIALQTAFIKVFEEVEDTDCKDYKAFLELNAQKIYRQGYSQFLAELCHHEVLLPATFIDTLSVLFKQISLQAAKEGKQNLIEEYCDCIVRMVKIFQGFGGTNNYMKTLKEGVRTLSIPQATAIISAGGVSISKKAKFCLMDVIDILGGKDA